MPEILKLSILRRSLNQNEVKDGLLVDVNDTISVNQKLFSLNNNINNDVYSPVRAHIESINYETGTIIGREIQDYSIDPVEIKICEYLDIKPKNILGYMEKKIGDFVRKGDLLAQVFPRKRVYSNYSGYIKEINNKTGNITVCYDKQPYELLSLSYGKVTKIINNKDIYIAIEAVKLDGKIGFGRDVGGELTLLSSKNSCFSDFLTDKIIYKNHVNYDDVIIFIEKRIKGLICNTISYDTIKMILKKHIGVALTGNEDIPFSIIILNSFSNKPCVENDTLLNDYKGKYTLLRPFTQIRAGVTRPDIFLFRK